MKHFWIRSQDITEDSFFDATLKQFSPPDLSRYDEGDFKDALHVIDYQSYQLLLDENKRLVDAYDNALQFLNNAKAECE